MPIINKNIPLALYVHVPWCIRKCPYCDFNSHALNGTLPETNYIEAILKQLDSHLPAIFERPIVSIFFGGGTPSLLTGQAIYQLLTGFSKKLRFAPNIEITLEANPGTIDYQRFRDFYQAGINRLSLGIQSFQDEKLTTLGRIHDKASAMRAIVYARDAGFDNFNLDIMYGLPNQTLNQAMADIGTALQFEPPHFSWYQLTLEPNTYFFHHPPTLPVEDDIWAMQQAGIALLADVELQQYEVSAYAKKDRQCLHNKNYWQFGDYLGLGPGAHSKLSFENEVIRFSQIKHPKAYLLSHADERPISRLNHQDLIFEFMLNSLRLNAGVSHKLFTERTGITLESIGALLKKAIKLGLLQDSSEKLITTEKGKRFLNDLTAIFLPDDL